MKIIISGGWGYGNLGDDAILDSTIRQLRAQYPGCECVVLTYSLVDSAAHIADGVRLLMGAHGLTDGGGCEIFRPSLTHDYSLIKKAWVKARFAFTETAAWFKYVNRPDVVKELRAEIASADLFVMSGGGYFNEKWLNKTRAQLLELWLAEQAGIPTVILGPTIGHFQGAIRKEIEWHFRQARLITVRDEFSFAEATQWSDQVSVVPDIALSNWLPEPQHAAGLGIIFTSSNSAFSDRVSLAIKLFNQDHGSDWPVKLFLTRRWKYDLRAAILLQGQLESRGVACDLVMPSNFHNLEKGLAGCQMVISENLHGLILAARNLVPVIAVNDYAVGSPNYKKFIAFLEQSNSQRLFFNAENSAESIVEKLRTLVCKQAIKRQELEALRQNVVRQYEQALDALDISPKRSY